ncbi:hypothetical protein H6G01_00175 [Leptolyngbya sp. FACHB-17]|nr:hypothetical protein [Leptolyngbya sp. FACHB-17]
MNTIDPILWLVEGLLVYLDEADVLTLFEETNSLSVLNSILLFDVLGRSLLDALQMAKHHLLEKLGSS